MLTLVPRGIKGSLVSCRLRSHHCTWEVWAWGHPVEGSTRAQIRAVLRAVKRRDDGAGVLGHRCLSTVTLCQMREERLGSGKEGQGPELGRQPTNAGCWRDQTAEGAENERGSAWPG